MEENIKIIHIDEFGNFGKEFNPRKKEIMELNYSVKLLTKKRKKYIERDYKITLKNIRKNLLTEKRNQGLTWRALSEKSCLSISKLKSIFYDDPNPGTSELLAIADILNLQYREIFIGAKKGGK